MQLFLHLNHEYFPKLQRQEQQASNVEISFVNKDKNEGMFKFINQVMPKVFMILFGSLLPRVSEELNNYLQLIQESMIGD